MRARTVLHWLYSHHGMRYLQAEAGAVGRRRRSAAAWNKGRQMSEETRSKISAAQKLRYRQDPALKTSMRLKLAVRQHLTRPKHLKSAPNRAHPAPVSAG